MPSFWNLNKHAAVQELGRHARSFPSLQNGSLLGKGTRSCNKPRTTTITEEAKGLHAMYLDNDGTSTQPIYSTIDRPNSSTVMIMQQPKHHEGSSSRALASEYNCCILCGQSLVLLLMSSKFASRIDTYAIERRHKQPHHQPKAN